MGEGGGEAVYRIYKTRGTEYEVHESGRESKIKFMCDHFPRMIMLEYEVVNVWLSVNKKKE